MFGIENIKLLVLFACNFTKQVNNSQADGWQWTDVFSFVSTITAIPDVVRSLPAVKQELADMDAAEREALNAYVVQEFDIPNDKLEAFIENALAFTLSAVALIEQWNDLKGS